MLGDMAPDVRLELELALSRHLNEDMRAQHRQRICPRLPPRSDAGAPITTPVALALALTAVRAPDTPDAVRRARAAAPSPAQLDLLAYAIGWDDAARHWIVL